MPDIKLVLPRSHQRVNRIAIQPYLSELESLQSDRVSEDWYRFSSSSHDAFAMARQHYSVKHRHPKCTALAGPGEKIVLMTSDRKALFIWLYSKYRADGQDGINCTIFRNESNVLSSVLIEQAMKVAWDKWPERRLFTFVNPTKVSSHNPGYCFKRAGWKTCGMSNKGLIILESWPTSS